MQDKLHHDERSDAGCHVVQDNSRAFRQFLELPYRRGLHNIEGPKKYKTREKSFPREGNRNQRDQLPGNLIDDNRLWIFAGRGARDAGSGGNSDRYGQRGQRERDSGPQIGRE